MNKLNFINFVKDQCSQKGIHFKISEGITIPTEAIGTECSGFFEESSMTKPTLGIAGGLDETTFFEVLAHEFSHSLQWSENSPFWTESRLSSTEQMMYSTRTGKDATGLETGDIFSMWIDNEVVLSKHDIQDLLLRTTGVEFDCERRTLELINSLELNLDSIRYAQKANAYLITYFFAKKEKMWTTSGKATYTVPEVYLAMPTKIDPEFCQNITSELIELIKKHCI